MLTVVDMLCAANGHYIYHINSIELDPKKVASRSKQAISDQLLVTKRFELNWNFYKGVATKEFKIRSSV